MRVTNEYYLEVNYIIILQISASYFPMCVSKQKLNIESGFYIEDNWKNASIIPTKPDNENSAGQDIAVCVFEENIWSTEASYNEDCLYF